MNTKTVRDMIKILVDYAPEDVLHIDGGKLVILSGKDFNHDLSELVLGEVPLPLDYTEAAYPVEYLEAIKYYG